MYKYLFIFALVFTPCSSVYAEADANTCKEHQCIAVIDAGSSGSRLHVYSYDFDTTHSPIHIKEVWANKIKPGFASIEPNQATIDAYLTTLLSGAPTSNVSVYFYATAGMRLVPPNIQTTYYQNLQHWFSQQSYWKLVESKTITGKDEALYDWLAVNYTLGTLQNSKNQSIGVMDMGGASVQIAFPTQIAQLAKDQSQVALDLYGQHINLSVHSFLGLGQTEMSHQFLNDSSCFSNEFTMPDGGLGHGDAVSCEKQVSMLMNSVHGINNRIQPLLASNPVDSWYAMGGISYLVDSPVFEFNDLQFSNQDLLTQADARLCRQPWGYINGQYPNNDYLYEYCLLSSYYYALMVDGYGINPGQNINYLPDSKNISWALGVVLHHSNSSKEKSSFFNSSGRL